MVLGKVDLNYFVLLLFFSFLFFSFLLFEKLFIENKGEKNIFLLSLKSLEQNKDFLKGCLTGIDPLLRTLTGMRDQSYVVLVFF